MRRQLRLNVSALALCIGLTWNAQAANFVVSNLNNSGAGSLREAINSANANGEADTITFSVSGTITLSATLPEVSTHVTIDGNGQNVTLSGGSTVRVMSIAFPGTLALQYITVANGRSWPGGGIYNTGNVSVRNCSFVNNTAADDVHFAYGGGIANFGGLTISDSTFSGNSAEVVGGGLFSNSLAVVTISGSTFSNNRASDGGGLWIETGDVSISNSTISGNAATEYGGGILNRSATLTLTNATISGNSASSAGGIWNNDQQVLIVGNTIIANNSGGDCASFGTINATAVNLVKDGSCAIPGALFGDPNLGPLAGNGGSTQTHALLAGSAAVDAGNDTICAASPLNNKDQRGEIRPSGSHCDLGAFELQQAPKFAFSGFLAPVDNPPTINTVRSGQSVPVKFSLGGSRGLNIFAGGYPKSQATVCLYGSAFDEIEMTASAGASNLSYDATTDAYTYVWKTDKAWKGCRQLIVQLTDGTFHTANFEFR